MEVGAQGTVGSLVLREVEYFRRMEVTAGGHGKKNSSQVVAASGGAASPRSNSKKPKPTPTKKKGAVAGNAGSFLPRMCSSAEVAEDPGSGRRERPSRVRYRPLGDDGDALPQQQD